MAYVYQHIREDSNTIFYIGIGENDKNNFKRAYSKYDRNKYWRNITNKISWKVEILHENLTWEQACDLEINYIQQYGRIDLQTGFLCNMTDGGDGGKKIIFTEEMKQKQRDKKNCKKLFVLHVSGKIIEFQSVGLAANKLKLKRSNIFKAIKENRQIKEFRFSFSPTFNNTFTPSIQRGKSNSIKIICIEDSKEFNSIIEAAKYYNVSPTSITNILKKRAKKLRNNKTFIYEQNANSNRISMDKKEI